MICVESTSLGLLLQELVFLRRQVTELQARGTQMALARQRVSALIDRYEELDLGPALAEMLREANRDA